MSIVMWVLAAVVIVAILAMVGGYVALTRPRSRMRERSDLTERQVHGENEQLLRSRERRVSQLDIRPLGPESRQGYAKRWSEVQERFVDAPSLAVSEADHLVCAVMAERGYPIGSFEQQVSNLSVTHSATLEHYRQAHEISRRATDMETSTEDLRQAMRHYRALFDDLLAETDERPRQPAPANHHPPPPKSDGSGER
ncbi:hypothetical protein [Nonomuraea endophytica]|uniref:hypothetical protein n=1 Tax=Nonomuraea endophytica TaxID=714136 RepID=UPI0037C9A86C